MHFLEQCQANKMHLNIFTEEGFNQKLIKQSP